MSPHPPPTTASRPTRIRLTRHCRQRLAERRPQWARNAASLRVQIQAGRVFTRPGDRAYHVLIRDPLTVLVVHLEDGTLTVATAYDPDPALHRDLEHAFSLPGTLFGQLSV